MSQSATDAAGAKAEPKRFRKIGTEEAFTVPEVAALADEITRINLTRPTLLGSP